ncbi:MBL fold metallo-hydrolase [Planococcus sp. CAU13]|uniref:MBL fold metallo-hydrolase n=1 Tax=Planococcus sp. CAU13 TaxID=1541197 RepID=UPI00052FF256|nr:MBL fold metallo-hydrolase [Planococcus sp. CAU13]
MLKKLTEHVYYQPHYQPTDRPVLGLISGEKYSLVMDGGNSPAHAAEFLKNVEELNVAPLKFLATTHWHWDHVFGIHTMDLLTLSHEKTKKIIDYMKTLKWDDESLDKRVETGEEIEFCQEMIKREMPTRDHLVLKSPELSFADRIEIDLGNLTCIVEHIGGVHAPDSSVVYIPEEKVLFLGDCLSPDFYSGDWSYDRNELQLLLSKIRKYEVDYYISSHDDPETPDKLWGYLDKLQDIGEIAGTELSLSAAKSRFEEIKHREPDAEETELLEYFINGNKKAKAI